MDVTNIPIFTLPCEGARVSIKTEPVHLKKLSQPCCKAIANLSTAELHHLIKAGTDKVCSNKETEVDVWYRFSRLSKEWHEVLGNMQHEMVEASARVVYRELVTQRYRC